MSTFRYLPLPPIAETGTTPPYTRILYLLPGAGEEPFNATLETVDVQRCLPYEALSYTWGRDDPSDYLWVGGIPLPIRPNLASALRCLRLPGQARRLWVDAVCIDQASADERSRQVRYMRLVYKHAARVIVWLGERTPGLEVAFKTAERIARIREMTHPGTAGGMLDREAVAELTVSIMSDLPAGSLDELSELLSRRYFSRCWCVQEVVASSMATAKAEDLEMSFFDILSSILFVNTHRGRLQPNTPLSLWGYISQQRGSHPMPFAKVEGSVGSFLSLLGMSRNMSASDDRDKIFSLLGICDEGIQPVLASTQIMGRSNNSRLLEAVRRGITRFSEYANSIVPDANFGRPRALQADYTRDTVLVYADLARFFVRQPPRMLEVLHHVQHGGDPGEGPFPSWVPKWFEPNSSLVFSGTFLAGLCDGHFRYFAELHDCPLDGNAARPMVLSLDGFAFDAVEMTSEVMAFGTDGDETIFSAWAQLFPQPLVPRTGTPYRDGMPLDEAFCKALLAAPLGSMFGSMATSTILSMGLHLDMGALEKTTPDDREKLTADLVRGYLTHAPQGPGEGDVEAAGLYKAFVGGARWFSNGRRAFRTRDGRVGIGPGAMRGGDELVALFGGRMPFVLRRRGDHHVFVGVCYVVDEELMWGKVTERVRFGRGGPPVQTFELW